MKNTKKFIAGSVFGSMLLSASAFGSDSVVSSLQVTNKLDNKYNLECDQTWGIDSKDDKNIIAYGETATLTSNFSDTNVITCMACLDHDCSSQGSLAVQLNLQRQVGWDDNCVHVVYYSGFTNGADGTWSNTPAVDNNKCYPYALNNSLTISKADIPN